MTSTDTPAPSSVPVGVDPNRASIARVYDAALGGKDNYQIDREIIGQVRQHAPEVQDTAQDNRNWLIRAVRFLVQEARVPQLIDCGSGLPTSENVHQVVARTNRDAKVVYIDNDPVVFAHAQALLDESGSVDTYFAQADIYKPDEVYAHDTIQHHIDLGEPVGLIHSSTMHHYPGEDYAELMAAWIDPLPSGSWVALSHFLDPETPELTALARRMEEIFTNSPMGSGYFRTRAQIRSMMPGLEIIEPQPGMAADVVPCAQWWPDGPKVRPLNQCQQVVGAIVGRKP
ncbi:SAM-dependent methyltransferase [Amycolatopsis aidingensis]|uniref:SAM-dependent methyltransferase n=1 Tax=Amycolatopsis aidingensis TaxID=2842453 RepID=UPI001C0C09E6|nr:SAM-dependent methyltransferase [Amycolatopsis aidingensis]